MRGFLKELGYGSDKPTDLFTDNQSVLTLSKNPVSHARAKHIDIRHHFVRDAIQDNVVSLHGISDGIIDRLRRSYLFRKVLRHHHVLYAKLQVGVLRRMQLYRFSLRDFLCSSDIGDQSILLVNVAIIHPHQQDWDT